MSLSPQQAEILEAIRSYTDAWGFAPSIRDICRSTGRSSTNAVYEILRRLERDGFITRAPGIGRTIQIIGGKDGGE